MIHPKLARFTRQMTLLASTLLFCPNDASALNVDPFAFCTNSCKSPGLCSSEPNLKSQCKKVCAPDHIWKQAASLQMSNSSKDFRTGDAQVKDKMIYSSPLAKCLDMAPKVEEAKPLDPTPLPTPAPGPTVKIPSAKDDLCASALSKAMNDLESNKNALDHGKVVLDTQKQEIAAALKALEAKQAG